jgi:hypothetical protein
MGYEVLVGGLRAAAGSYRTVGTELGSTVEITHVEPDSLGHVELAAWLKAVVEQCGNAHTALKDGANGLGDDLDAAAHHYESADEQTGQWFQSPFDPLSQPYQPFDLRTPAQP